jgi:hypothetical protein
LDVLESAVHETTVASIVAVISGAVDEILFAEGDEIAGLPEGLALERSGLKHDDSLNWSN